MSTSFALEQGRDSQYDLLDLLGEGGFASVYKVLHRDTNTLYALKVVQLKGTSEVRAAPGGAQVSNDDIEVELMRCLQKTDSTAGFNHPNIIALKDNWKQSNDRTLCMVLEFCSAPLSDGIEIGKYLADIDRILEHVCCALHYCESEQVLHLDIKPDNVLVRVSSKGNIYKLADFGLSHFRDSMMASILSAIGGTDQFKAPETIGKKKFISPKADVWATGLTLHWVLYKRFPFVEGGRFMNIAEIRDTLEEDPDFLTIPLGLNGASEKTTSAINSMLVVKVDRRASPSELAASLGLVHLRSSTSAVLTKRDGEFSSDSEVVWMQRQIAIYSNSLLMTSSISHTACVRLRMCIHLYRILESWYRAGSILTLGALCVGACIEARSRGAEHALSPRLPRHGSLGTAESMAPWLHGSMAPPHGSSARGSDDAVPAQACTASSVAPRLHGSLCAESTAPWLPRR
jgi:serine/threonine protein kinase